MNETLKKKGLIHKYNITKTSGLPIDEKAKYFVLRYDDFGDDPKHIRACKIALLVYAELIENHLPLLSKDLKKGIKLKNN